MARLVKVLVVAVLLLAGIAALAEMTTTTGTFRYKMTVEVETPEGLKTGSAVREVKVVIAHPEIQGLNDTRAFVKGEAVVVDLGKRGLLFAIMHPDDSYRVVFDAFPGPPSLTMEGLEYYAHLKSTKAISVKQIPVMVKFEDINIPKSILSVDPQEFSSAFGKGVRLKDVTIEMTDQPVSWGISDTLTWLKGLKGNLDGSSITTGSSYANTVDVGSFERK